jgi:predicted DNA binding CopG/RHH family protein
MSSRIRYTEGEMGRFEVVKDFLPSPAQLADLERNVRVTINLRKASIDFFKSMARENHVQYQRVIRGLLDSYASAYAGPASGQSSRHPRAKVGSRA